jgi:hypothetical protein
MSKKTRVTLGLAIVFSVYLQYLFVEASTKSFLQYYLIPFFRVSQDIVFSYWLNLVALMALILWVIWFVQFVREDK